MKKHYRTENDCLNCGTILQGKFCHVCGQENLELKENFGHMMSHAISDYFHFDHLFFHTLKPLLFKPGYLTNEYMAGRRAQYLHPIKMYIFISIVYFLLLFQTGHETVTTVRPGAKPFSTAKIADSTKKARDSVNKAIDKETDLNAAQKAALKKKIAQAQTISDYGIITISDENRGPNKWFHPTTKDTSYQQYLAKQKKLPEEDQDGFITRQWNKKVFDYTAKYGNQAKEIFVENFEHNIPKMMFILLPLFALILKITFFRSKKFYVEHLIYAFHFHCFVFLFLGIIMLLKFLLPANWGINGWIDAIATFYIMWYVYRSLRVVYHRSRFRTVTKVIGMSLMYFVSFSFCLTLIVFITAII
jgi:hypothetical protein